MDRDNTQLPSSGVYMQNQESSSKLTMILIIIVVLALLGGAVYFRQRIFNKLGLNAGSLMVSDTPTPTPEPVPTDTPAPTPITLDRSTFKVKVLNGTSQSGLAASVGDTLKAKGWTIAGVGNATSSAVDQTQIRVKADGTEAGKVMMADLSSDYQATVSADLSKSTTYDIEVTIGKK